MRNLKRALSLAVAAVMVIGMTVIGTGASYDDVTSADNQEAIEVLQAVGIMTGDDQGNFNPDKGVTRAEMAVIMTKVLDLNVSNYSVSAMPFTDVPDWAKSYVAAIYAEGVTGGISDTLYGTDDPITAAQAGLMLMKALGYFQYPSDLADGWVLATVRQAGRIGLFDGIDAGAEEALTRNEVAQLVLNTLESSMVEVTGTEGITINGITVGNTIKYEEIEVKDEGAKNYATGADGSDGLGTLQLCEDLFDRKLTKTPATGADDMGRPGIKWTYNTVIGTYGDEADHVVVAKKAYKNIEAAYKDLVDEDGSLAADAAKKLNNGDWKSVDGNSVDIGDILEFYLTDGKVTTVVGTRYSIAKIDDISTNLTKAQKEDGNTCKIKLEGVSGTFLNKDFAGYDADTYVEGAYVLYVKDGGKSKILASELADYVEGKVDATKGGEARINGTYYKTSASVSIGDEGTFYLDAAGRIVAKDAVSTKSGDYMYIYTITSENTTNSDGIKGNVYTAYGVLADGTKVSYEIAVDVVAEEEEDGLERAAGTYFADSTVAITDEMVNKEKDEWGGMVIAYSVNSDNELVWKEAEDKIEEKDSLSVDKSDAAGTDSSTEFIFTKKGDSKVSVSVATGYKNVKIENLDAYTVTDTDSGDILYVFVVGENGSVTSSVDTAVVLDAEAVESKNEDDKTVYTYAVAIDGEETELTFEDEQSFTDGQVFAYVIEGDYAEMAADEEQDKILTMDEVETVTDDYVVLNKQYNLTGDEVIYTITMEYEDKAAFVKGEVDTVTVSEGGSFVAKDVAKEITGSKVVYTVDGDDLVTVFIYENIY